jgi:hypothetical protein
MKFGIHNPSWVYGPDPAEAFEGLKAKRNGPKLTALSGSQ